VSTAATKSKKQISHMKYLYFNAPSNRWCYPPGEHPLARGPYTTLRTKKYRELYRCRIDSALRPTVALPHADRTSCIWAIADS